MVQKNLLKYMKEMNKLRESYNANLYLTFDDLNTIEDKIYEITNEIQEKVFNNKKCPLRNIKIGDNLSGKTLYLSFPRDSYKDINNTTTSNIITIDNDTYIAYMYSNNKHYIYVRYDGKSYYIYAKNNSSTNPYLNYVRYKLPFDFGIVTNINTNDTFYDYIKIYDDTNIIPNYVKNEWVKNEPPSMQKIDKIEEGIKNIGDYFYKPIMWQGSREWLGTAELGASNYYGVGIKNISFQDLNRWVDNLNLIDFDDLSELTIWNSDISQLEWNLSSNIDWEEL